MIFSNITFIIIATNVTGIAMTIIIVIVITIVLIYIAVTYDLYLCFYFNCFRIIIVENTMTTTTITVFNIITIIDIRLFKP